MTDRLFEFGIQADGEATAPLPALALRRLGKEVAFVQYRGEGHHPKSYANRLDWAMRLRDFFGHLLLSRPAPAWLTDGVPYVPPPTAATPVR